MIKTRRPIHDREFGRIEECAKDAIEIAHGIVVRNKEEEKQWTECVHCKTAISSPCYCYQCPPGECFICDDCEQKDLAFYETHKKLHAAVKVPKNTEGKKRPTEERPRFPEEGLLKTSRPLR